MFQMFELLCDIDNLRQVGLTNEEIEGYLEMFFDNYKELFGNVEVV